MPYPPRPQLQPLPDFAGTRDSQIAHAGGSHEQRDIDAGGHLGDPLPPLVRWPGRD